MKQFAKKITAQWQKRHLIYYMPLWLFPIVVIILDRIHNPNVGWVIAISCVLSFGIAAIPYLKGQVKMIECLAFGTGISLIIWTICVLTNGIFSLLLAGRLN